MLFFYAKDDNLTYKNFDGGGRLIYIIFDDRSINTWGIFLPEKIYSEEIQLFLKKVNSIMNSEGSSCLLLTATVLK